MKRVLLTAAVMMLAACGGAQSDTGSAATGTAESKSSRAMAIDKTQTMGLRRGEDIASVGAIADAAQPEQEKSASAPPASSPLDATNEALHRPAMIVDTASSSTSQIAPAMVIRNGQASVEVEKLDPAIIKVRQLALQLGGYIANSAISGGHDQIRSATLELKIPAQRFDQAVNGLGTLGKLESVNATAEDVGEEYVDITARVTNAHRLEERLITLLATRTGKLQDVLLVERELARVREEIERYEGRLRYLKTRSAVSTLSVTVHEPVPILGQSPGQNPIVAAIRQAWRNFVGFVAAGIAALGVVVPLAALVVIGWLLYRRVRKRSS